MTLEMDYRFLFWYIWEIGWVSIKIIMELLWEEKMIVLLTWFCFINIIWLLVYEYYFDQGSDVSACMRRTTSPHFCLAFLLLYPDFLLPVLFFKSGGALLAFWWNDIWWTSFSINFWCSEDGCDWPSFMGCYIEYCPCCK